MLDNEVRSLRNNSTVIGLRSTAEVKTLTVESGLSDDEARVITKAATFDDHNAPGGGEVPSTHGTA